MMNWNAESRSSGPLRHRIEVEYELDDVPEYEALEQSEVEPTTKSWRPQLERVEQLLTKVQHEKAPQGLAERIMERIRLAMREDMARLPAQAHEAIAQAYTLVMLSTLPVLLSASWAVANTMRARGDIMPSLISQLTEILQSSTANLREIHTVKYAGGSSRSQATAPELVEMTMDLIPLTVMKVLGETLRELQGELHGVKKVQSVHVSEEE